MTGNRFKMAAVILLLGGLLATGCAEQMQYRSPYSQEEASPTYRQLYPGPFGPEQGPSATSSGDE
jgi:hypothetical protein